MHHIITDSIVFPYCCGGTSDLISWNHLGRILSWYTYWVTCLNLQHLAQQFFYRREELTADRFGLAAILSSNNNPPRALETTVKLWCRMGDASGESGCGKNGIVRPGIVISARGYLDYARRQLQEQAVDIDLHSTHPNHHARAVELAGWAGCELPEENLITRFFDLFSRGPV